MKNDKEEYRTTYIGGSRNFLLIKYADSKKNIHTWFISITRLLFFREDSIYCGDINEPITVNELKAIVSMGIRTFSAGRIKKMNYVFKN